MTAISDGDLGWVLMCDGMPCHYNEIGNLWANGSCCVDDGDYLAAVFPTQQAAEEAGAKMIERIRRNGIISLEVTPEAMEAFTAEMHFQPIKLQKP